MAYSNIAESLLEMHYFRTLVRYYQRALGTRQIHIFKPATTSEQWYGFDQAFFTANTPKREAIRDLRAYIQSGAAPRFTSFRAFLLQFKVVEIARKRSPLSPPGWNAPYYRSELYLEPNRNTGISQHETLRRLSGLSGASVAYVCPMIFEENDVLKRPLLTDLRLVDISSSPDGWLTNQRHFIAFQDPFSTPTWFSDPVPGKALEFEQIFKRATPFTAEGLYNLLANIRKVLLIETKSKAKQDFESLREHRIEQQLDLIGDGEHNILPPCLSIVADIA